MSAVYWGIVTGLLSMVVLLFVCLEILYRGVSQATGVDRRHSEGQGEKEAGRGSKHAA